MKSGCAASGRESYGSPRIQQAVYVNKFINFIDSFSYYHSFGAVPCRIYATYPYHFPIFKPPDHVAAPRRHAAVKAFLKNC